MLKSNLVFILFIIALTQRVDAALKVLFMGDSWADNEFADRVFEDKCVGSFVENGAWGGTTARQWRHDARVQPFLDENIDAVSVWVTLGGNDLLHSDCADTEVVANMRAVLAKVTDSIPEAKILVIPYGRLPYPDTYYYPCSSAPFEQYSTDLQELANEFPMVTYVDTFYFFGGSSNEPSDLKYWSDDIHINEEGYKLLWSDLDVMSVICPCNSPDTVGCEIEVQADKCNFLTFFLELLFGWLGFHFCDLNA